MTMLRELHISNLAIISDARVDFAPGLNCFTGATGAGKSLIIGAIEILLGLRSPTDMLRKGSDEGRISGVFEITSKSTLAAIGAITDAQVSDAGGEVLLTRRLHASGRSSVSLNGNPITLVMLRQISEHLVDVHGQHDQQYLLKPSNQLDTLDQFGLLQPLRDEYGKIYADLRTTVNRLAELRASEDLNRQRLELYRFQAGEIDKAELQPSEYEELSARSRVLANLEKLKREAGATHVALYEAEGSLLERLKMMAGVISELAGLDTQLGPIAGNLRDASISLEEVAFDLSRYLDRLDLDPSEIGEVDDRLNTLNRILNKYGQSVEGVIAYRAEIGAKISELEKATGDLSKFDSNIQNLRAELNVLGKKLSAERSDAANRLWPLVQKQLVELGMEKATFRVTVEPAAGDGYLPGTFTGFDTVEFMAMTNPGQPMQPLRKIASGGEMSRIMLALKGILSQSDRVSVLVFDEIDANVGGRLGSVIGKKLRALADGQQVLCITHLPQIASYADRHLTVRKEVVGNQTTTTVRVMDGTARIEELAEMIGGQRITDTTRAQASELLDAARSDFKPVAKRGRKATLR